MIGRIYKNGTKTEILILELTTLFPLYPSRLQTLRIEVLITTTTPSIIKSVRVRGKREDGHSSSVFFTYYNYETSQQYS